MKKKRYLLVDQIRGLAVLLMIIFHFCYDLDHFQYIQIDIDHHPFWWAFPRFIVFLFLIAVGLSLPLAHPQEIRWRPFWKRWFKLTFLATLISLATYHFFNAQWIYFGTIHCIAACSLVVLPVLYRPKIAGVLAAIISILVLSGFHYQWPRLPHPSMDHIPLYPWVAIVLGGIWLNSMGFHKLRLPACLFLVPLGRFSLEIYVVHQPLLYGLFTLFDYW